MTGALFLFVLLAIVAAAEAAYSFARYLGERPAEELRRRLQTLGTPASVHLLRQRRFASSPRTSEWLAGFALAERLETLLGQTDTAMTVLGLIGRMAALALLSGALGVALKRPILAGALIPALGAAPLVWVLGARASRTRKISRQLPEALDMMGRAVAAGHALPSAIKLVAQEAPAPLAVEFGKTYEQQNLGISLAAAVSNMAERVPGSLDLKLLSVTVTIQSDTGGNIVEVLEKISETMRERRQFDSKLQALTAEGRMSAIILGSLPIVVALLVSVANPTYLGELGHGLGAKIAVGGAVLWVCGALWLRNLSKVAY